MNREERQEVKNAVDRRAVLKAVGAEIDRLDCDKGAKPALCVEIRLSRNNHTNTGSVKYHQRMNVSGLHFVQDALGYIPGEEGPNPAKPKKKTAKKEKNAPR